MGRTERPIFRPATLAFKAKDFATLGHRLVSARFWLEPFLAGVADKTLFLATRGMTTQLERHKTVQIK
jgi:hypothetical protein